MNRKLIVQRFCMTIAALCAASFASGTGWAGDPPQKGGASAATKTGAPVQPTVPGTGGDAAGRKAAAAAYEKAKTSFDADDFASASKYARQAYDLQKLPQYGLYLARSLAETGEILEAIRVYEEVSKMDVPAGAPDLYVKAVELAKKEAPDARKRLVKVQIVKPAESSDGARVSVDGKDREPGASVETNPGQHRIEIHWGPSVAGQNSMEVGSTPVTVEVSLTEGSTNRLTVSVPRAQTSTVETPGPMAPHCQPPQYGPFEYHEHPPAPPKVEKTSFHLEGAVSLGAGVAGLGVGAVAGMEALSMAGDLKTQCPGARCPAESKSVANTAHGLATVSTAGFAVGGGGLLAGALLLALPHWLPAKGNRSFAITPTFGGVAATGEF